MKRPELAQTTGLPSLAERGDCVTLSRFPNLEELLLDPNWEDLTPKGKRCLFLFIDDIAIRLLFKLEDACLKFSLVGRDLDDLLMATELALKQGAVVWEQDKPRPHHQGKKKK